MLAERVIPSLWLQMTHWQHPNFHAYFPAGNSYPSILGEMMESALGCIGFSWAAGPSCTELEIQVMDWLGKVERKVLIGWLDWWSPLIG